MYARISGERHACDSRLFEAAAFRAAWQENLDIRYSHRQPPWTLLTFALQRDAWRPLEDAPR